MSKELIEQIEKTAKETKDDAKSSLDQAIKMGKEKKEHVKKDVKSNIYTLKKSAHLLVKEGKKRVGDAQKYLENHTDVLIDGVKKKPLFSLLIAGTVGCLISLVSRK